LEATAVFHKLQPADSLTFGIADNMLSLIYTVFQKKLVHQSHIDKLAPSQRIFKILSLAHSAENLL